MRTTAFVAGAIAAAGMLAAQAPSSPQVETVRITHPSGAKNTAQPGERVAVADTQLQAVPASRPWQKGWGSRSAGNPPDNRAWKHRPIAGRMKRKKAKAKARRRRMRES